MTEENIRDIIPQKEFELGQEVICTQLLWGQAYDDLAWNASTKDNRSVGHIGRIISDFPMYAAVHVMHREWDGNQELEFYTYYKYTELELFEPDVSPLKKAIYKLTRI